MPVEEEMFDIIGVGRFKGSQLRDLADRAEQSYAAMTKGMDHRSKLKCPEVRDTRMLIEALQAALGGNTVMLQALMNNRRMT